MAPRVAVIAGDGVGKEVVPEGIKVLSWLCLDFEASPAERAIDAVCEDGGVLTCDLGGTASTAEVWDALLRALG